MIKIKKIKTRECEIFSVNYPSMVIIGRASPKSADSTYSFNIKY